MDAIVRGTSHLPPEHADWARGPGRGAGPATRVPAQAAVALQIDDDAIAPQVI